MPKLIFHFLIIVNLNPTLLILSNKKIEMVTFLGIYCLSGLIIC